MKITLVFPILLFSSLYVQYHLRRLSYLFLLFFGTLHSVGYIFSFPLCLFHLFSAICKASSDNCFVLLHMREEAVVILPTFISFMISIVADMWWVHNTFMQSKWMIEKKGNFSITEIIQYSEGMEIKKIM